jgi:hypothetical protein
MRDARNNTLSIHADAADDPRFVELDFSLIATIIAKFHIRIGSDVAREIAAVLSAAADSADACEIKVQP